jgi:ABC-type phosphate transport system auxiliary subunit
MFNKKLKEELARKEALLFQYRERIDALESVEKENEELKLKLRIMEMYCNDDEAILELLEAQKEKLDARQDVVIDSKESLYPKRAHEASMQNAALYGRGAHGCSNGISELAVISGLAGLSGMVF